MATHDVYQKYLKITDAVVDDAFAGTNFGRTDFRTILAEVVIKRAAGYHCGHTATTIAKELKLITEKTEKPTALGFQVVMDMYYRRKLATKQIEGNADA
ncbi:TPA: hypothetical protein ACX4EX_000266 [Yersinia enterocolitica]|nr:hypothetical protein [Yersinia enterocolitica]CRE61663.1 Uncharacterised protein [Yersinia enterocolitica]HDL7349292.1 hypothetical protein [Yersinia enterocolitica]HDX5736664.1 hypothetical protein [Yersinia enterocolitica]HEI6714408.1 hypothetical protein [Yersinia enterocolitica]